MIENNATIGHCVVCGKKAPRQLCPGCQKEHTDESGKLHPAILAIQNDQKAEADRQRRNRDRIKRGAVPDFGTKRRGAPQAYGVTFVSWDKMQDEAATG